jgi:hypothetical protein
VTKTVEEKNLCGVTLEATVETGNPRSRLKNVMSIRSKSIWVSILVLEKLSSTKQTLGTKTHKQCCHVGILEVVVPWPLACNVKAKLSFSTNQIIKILCLLNRWVQCEAPPNANNKILIGTTKYFTKNYK